MSGEIERKKFAADSERTGQSKVSMEAEMREQAGEQTILAAEFRKLASQLGELRRRETHLLRRVALLEIERRQEQASREAQSAELTRLNTELSEARHKEQASLEAQSAELIRLNTELSQARHRITELDRALEAQGRQLELNRRQGDARRKRTEHLEAALESRLAEVASLKGSISWRLTRPLRWFAEKFPWSARRPKHILKFFSEANTFPLGSRVRSRIRRNRNARLLAASKLFDRDWYIGQYPDVREAGVDPVLHYLEHGASEGRNPSPLFDTDSYMQQNSDVRSAGINPLVHYIMHGAREGRQIRWSGDRLAYLMEKQRLDAEKNQGDEPNKQVSNSSPHIE
jgi:hypothetical protein